MEEICARKNLREKKGQMTNGNEVVFAEFSFNNWEIQ